MLQAGEVSYLTQFCQEYEALKVSENWKKIIDLGLKALDNSQITEKNSALIQHKLSSCYYYLGDHDKALEYAKNAYESAVQANDNGLKARSLYLSSAIYRMLALKTAGEKRKEYKDCSQVNINAAFKLLNDHPDISNVVRAKVYFNDGALKHDLMQNFDSAIGRYLQAEQLFKQEKFCDDEVNRTVIRRIRASAESKRKSPSELISEVKALNIDKKTKTGIHKSLLLSRLLIEYDEICAALICAQECLEIAKDKSMLTEVRMLNKIIRYIEEGHYQAANQQQPAFSRTAAKESHQVVTQQRPSVLNELEIGQWQDQAVNQDEAQSNFPPEWQYQTALQQQSIFLHPSHSGLYQNGILQSQIFLNPSDIEVYQANALQQLALFTELETEQDQAVNQGAIQQSIFFTGGQYQVVSQQQPIFFNASEGRQDQDVTQRPQSFLSELETSIVADRQYHK